MLRIFVAVKVFLTKQIKINLHTFYISDFTCETVQI